MKSSLSLAQLMILLMVEMQGVKMMVIWVSIATGVLMKVMEGVSDVCQVHQIT